MLLSVTVICCNREHSLTSWGSANPAVSDTLERKLEISGRDSELIRAVETLTMSVGGTKTNETITYTKWSTTSACWTV